jgi:predicted small secreted protein
MRLRSIALLVACALGLSACETINDAWHDVFGLNGATQPASEQTAQAPAQSVAEGRGNAS